MYCLSYCFLLKVAVNFFFFSFQIVYCIQYSCLSCSRSLSVFLICLSASTYIDLFGTVKQTSKRALLSQLPHQNLLFFWPGWRGAQHPVIRIPVGLRPWKMSPLSSIVAFTPRSANCLTWSLFFLFHSVLLSHVLVCFSYLQLFYDISYVYFLRIWQFFYLHRAL